MTTIATPDGVRDGHVLVPLADTAGGVARISFDNGLGRLDLRAGNLDGLLEARFTKPLPVIWAAGHTVHVEYPLGSRILRRTGPNAIRVNPAVPWALDVHGGAEHLDADLTGVDVRSIAFHAGAAHLRLALGRPSGSRTVRLAAVKDLRVERPAGVPVRVELAKGATRVTLGEKWLGAVGGGLIDQTPGYDTAEHRYLLTVSGGVDQLTLVETG
jgi:hypothetical protein